MYNCSVMLGTEWFSYKFNESEATLHQFKELLFNSMLMKWDFWHVFCGKHDTFDDTKRTKNLRQNKIFSISPLFSIHLFQILLRTLVLCQNFHWNKISMIHLCSIQWLRQYMDVPAKPSKLYFACCAITLHIIMWSTCPCSYVSFST